MCGSIQVSNLVSLVAVGVQVAILAVVAIYTWETHRLRKLARAQVEATQKPCITLYQFARADDDAAMATNGVVGDQQVGRIQGNLALQNFGSGPALNVLWEIQHVAVGHATAAGIKRGTVPIISPSRGPFRITSPFMEGTLAEAEIRVMYQSLSGARYKSTIAVRHRVISGIRFEEIKDYEFPPRENIVVLPLTASLPNLPAE